MPQKEESHIFSFTVSCQLRIGRFLCCRGFVPPEVLPNKMIAAQSPCSIRYQSQGCSAWLAHPVLSRQMESQSPTQTRSQKTLSISNQHLWLHQGLIQFRQCRCKCCCRQQRRPTLYHVAQCRLNRTRVRLGPQEKIFRLRDIVTKPADMPQPAFYTKDQ